MTQLATVLTALGTAADERANRDAAIRRRLLAFRNVLDLNQSEVDAVNGPGNTIAYLDGEQVTAIITAILNEDSYGGEAASIDREGVKNRVARIYREAGKQGGARASVGVLEYAFGGSNDDAVDVASKGDHVTVTATPTAIVDSAKVATGDVAVRCVSEADGVEYLLYVTISRSHWTGEISQAMRFTSAKDARAFVETTWQWTTPPAYTLEAMLPASVYAIQNDGDWTCAVGLHPDWSTVCCNGCLRSFVGTDTEFHLSNIIEVLAAQKHSNPENDDCYGLQGVFRLNNGDYVYVNATLNGGDCGNTMEREHDWIRIYYAPSLAYLHSEVIGEADIEALRKPFVWNE